MKNRELIYVFINTTDFEPGTEDYEICGPYHIEIVSGCKNIYDAVGKFCTAVHDTWYSIKSFEIIPHRCNEVETIFRGELIINEENGDSSKWWVEEKANQSDTNTSVC